MKDTFVTAAGLGQAIREHRQSSGLKATDIARRSGRARNVLYRLEAGHDITVASLLDILRAVGLSLHLQTSGMPTIQDMRRLFDEDDAA